MTGPRRSAISAQLLPISVADPAGGLPWGIRLAHTTRGLVCVQVGRLFDGRLGVLGQDGEFHNDGLFHELPAAVLDPYTCSQPQDTVLYSSEGLAAAGAMPGPTSSCLYPGAAPEHGARLPACPTADERLIAFGLLGPNARSVYYPAAEGVQTLRTVGSDGAYLLVLRQPPVNLKTLAAQSGRCASGSRPCSRPRCCLAATQRLARHRARTGSSRSKPHPRSSSQRNTDSANTHARAGAASSPAAGQPARAHSSEHQASCRSSSRAYTPPCRSRPDPPAAAISSS